MNKIRILFYSYTLGLIMIACSTRTETPHLHAVENERLRELMARMNSLILSERQMTSLEMEQSGHHYAERIAKVSERLGRTVDAILETLPDLKLQQADQSTFVVLAEQLRRQAKSLKDAAIQHRNEDLPDQLEEIESTCRACHQLFRSSGITGPSS